MISFFRQCALFGLIAFLCMGLAYAQDDPIVPQDETTVILAFGDSLIAGYGLQEGQDFASQLERVLRPVLDTRVQVINAGVSGETTAGGLARVEWTLDNIDDKVDLVILELGANDMLRGLPPAKVQENLYQIIEKFADRGIHVLLAGMRASSNLGRDYVEAFNRVYPNLAGAYPTVSLYPFFLDGVAGNPELNQEDGIHPNAKGVKEIAERIKPHVLKELVDARDPSIANPLK